MQPYLRTTHASLFLLWLSNLCLYLHRPMVAGQQSYTHYSFSRNCHGFHPENAGYICESSNSSCKTLVYFHVQTEFASLRDIAKRLLNSTTAAPIANASSLSTLTPDLKPGEGLYIPVQCTCNGNFSSYNISYTIMPGDIILQIGKTYQGLTTCQAIQNANPQFSATSLPIGDTLVLPLRCACPSTAQEHKGIRFLVTYPVGYAMETISSVIDMFAVDREEFLFANKFANASVPIFAATTVLLPFKDKPTLPPNASVAPSPAPATSDGTEERAVALPATSSTALAGVIIIIVVAIAAASCISKMSQGRHLFGKTFLRPRPIASPIVLPSQIGRNPQVNLSQGLSDLATSDSLVIYTINDIYQATQGFHASARIKGAVYRGTLKGRDVAIKKTERDHVLKEVRILQMIHHSSIISLLGFCIASPIGSYLVYEYAENGSLHDWLLGHMHRQGLASASPVLACRDRLQIALDIALAMEYLHDLTCPRFVHKNVNSNNILLDSKMRGRMANFALAIAIDEPHANHHQAQDEEHASHEHVINTKESSNAASCEVEMNSTVSPKVDVYAFGEVLLELLRRKDTPECRTGNLSAADAIGGQNVKEDLEAFDEHNADVHRGCAHAVAALARSCLAHDASTRPSARTVGFTLSKLLEVCLSHH